MRLFESNKKPLVVYNPADILMKYNMKPGDFVSIVYLADVLHGESSTPIVSGKTKMCYNINPETDMQLEQYIDELDNIRLKQLLTEFRESSKYQELLSGTAKTKTCKLDLSTEHIIKVSWLTCNWKSFDDLAKFYKKQSDAELDLRREYGFEDGFESPLEYDEEDVNWRDKHNGRNILPRTKKNFGGNVYKEQTIIPGLYTSLSNPENVAIRFAYNRNASKKTSQYFYVNGDGSLFELNRAFISFLIYAYKKTNEEKVVEMLPEEKEFVKKLHAILKEVPSTAELTMKCDQVLFMKSTARDTNNGSVPFVWINTKNIYKNYGFINPEELNKLIKGKVRKLDPEEVNGTIENINVKGKSISDLVSFDKDGKVIADPAAVRQRLGIAESLNKLSKQYNQRKSLYESIMTNISKTIKKALNENNAFDQKMAKEIIHILQDNELDSISIADYQIALADSEQMVCDLELDIDDSLIMLDEYGDGICGNITQDEWADIINAVKDILE